MMENVSTDRSRPRFLIADDHAIFAEALRAFLERTYPVVGVVSDGRALIEAAARLKPGSHYRRRGHAHPEWPRCGAQN